MRFRRPSLGEAGDGAAREPVGHALQPWIGQVDAGVPVLDAGVLNQDLAGGEVADVGGGLGVSRGHGHGIDGELEVPRQVGVEVAHDAHGLVHVGIRRALDVAHHGYAPEVFQGPGGTAVWVLPYSSNESIRLLRVTTI